MASLLVVLFGLVFFAGCVLGGVWDLAVYVRRPARAGSLLGAQ